MVGVVVLAMVAAFLALRLYSVLGKRTGHEQPFVTPSEPAARPIAAQVEEAALTAPPLVDAIIDPAASAGVRAIVAADPSFDVGRFLEGAKAAYRMILEAFWRGDKEELEPYTSGEVRDAFVAAIDQRAEQGHVLDNRLVAIERAVIAVARIEGREAELVVRFDADIAAVTRDGQGGVVAGSLTDAVPTHDAWTFSRTLRSSDPNWILTDTDESA